MLLSCRLIQTGSALALVFSLSFISTLHALPGLGDKEEIESNLSPCSSRRNTADINNNNNNIDINNNNNIKQKPPLPNKSDRQKNTKNEAMDSKSSKDSPLFRSYSHSMEDEEGFEDSSHNQISDNRFLDPEEYEMFRTQALFLFKHNILHLARGDKDPTSMPPSTRKKMRKLLKMSYEEAMWGENSVTWGGNAWEADEVTWEENNLMWEENIPRKGNFFVTNCTDLYNSLQRCMQRNVETQEFIVLEREAEKQKHAVFQAKKEAESIFSSGPQVAWDTLPRDVFLNHLFPKFTVKDLLGLRRTSKFFRNLTHLHVFRDLPHYPSVF